MSSPSPSPDPRYTLSNEEKVWCTDLLAHLKANSLPIPSSAFLLAQFAIIAKGNIKKGALKVQNYHSTIVEEYNYTTSSAQLSPAFNFSNNKFGEGLFSICGQDNGAPVMLAIDPTNYKPANLDFNGGKGSEWNLMVGDFLLCMDACCSDLEEIRKGSVWINDCKGLGWQNFSLKVEEKAAKLYQDAYPCKFKAFPLVDAGIIVGAIMKLCKLFLSKKLANRMIVCTQDDLYNTLGYNKLNLPKCVGGNYEGDYSEWLKKRLEEREVSVEKVVFPGWE